MFGFVRPYEADLSEEEKKRYRAMYCGLCRKLNEGYGLAGRMGLNYDMTFLTMLLSSLYEPDEETRERFCPPHPMKKHLEAVTPFTDYAAAMTVALTYFKALDDWEDEGKTSGRLYAGLLKKHYQEVKEKWPRQCGDIEESIRRIHEIEASPSAQPEQAADCSGRMLGSLFAVKDDYFKPSLAWMGHSLGKFIYMVDAAVDYEQDQKKKCYNPLALMGVTPEEAGALLRQPLGRCSQIFEDLPLVQDVNILRNILYSGVWQNYNQAMHKKAGEKDGQ